MKTRVSKNLKMTNCHIPVNDPSGKINCLNGINKQTIKIYFFFKQDIGSIDVYENGYGLPVENLFENGFTEPTLLELAKKDINTSSLKDSDELRLETILLRLGKNGKFQIDQEDINNVEFRRNNIFFREWLPDCKKAITETPGINTKLVIELRDKVLIDDVHDVIKNLFPTLVYEVGGRFLTIKKFPL